MIEYKHLFDPLEFQFNCNHSNDISLVENARFIFGTVLRVPPFRWQIVELTIHHVYDKSIHLSCSPDPTTKSEINEFLIITKKELFFTNKGSYHYTKKQARQFRCQIIELTIHHVYDKSIHLPCSPDQSTNSEIKKF